MNARAADPLQMLVSRATLARAEQVKPIPFPIRAHSARASLGLPKLAYLSASSISAAAVAISLPLCNLSKLIRDMTLHAMWIQVDHRLGSRLQCGGAGYAECERRGPGQVAAYSTVRFRVPRRTRGTPCAAVGRCARACGPGLLDSNIPSHGRQGSFFGFTTNSSGDATGLLDGRMRHCVSNGAYEAF